MVKAESQDKQLVDIDPSTVRQRVSAYGVLVRSGDVLLVKTHSNNWELPGGTPEPGETLKQGLARELLEEVAIRATIGRLIYVRESFYHSPSGKTYHSLQFYFLIESDDMPSTADALVYAFLPLEQIASQDVNKSTYLALQHITKRGVAYEFWDGPERLDDQPKELNF